jgi:hypothetical protein
MAEETQVVVVVVALTTPPAIKADKAAVVL